MSCHRNLVSKEIDVAVPGRERATARHRRLGQARLFYHLNGSRGDRHRLRGGNYIHGNVLRRTALSAGAPRLSPAALLQDEGHVGVGPVRVLKERGGQSRV